MANDKHRGPIWEQSMDYKSPEGVAWCRGFGYKDYQILCDKMGYEPHEEYIFQNSQHDFEVEMIKGMY